MVIVLTVIVLTVIVLTVIVLTVVICVLHVVRGSELRYRAVTDLSMQVTPAAKRRRGRQ